MAVKDDEKDDNILVVEDQDPIEDISGEIDSSGEEEKDKKRPVKKRGNDNQKRINELWMKRKEAEDEAGRQAAAAQSATAKSSEYERITASALEENINTKRELLTERLIRARESGDAKKDAEITAELSKIEAQAAQIERYKIENQVRTVKKEDGNRHESQNQTPQTFDDIYESQNKFGKEWLDKSRDWYDNSSDDYDHDRVSDVTLYARSLEENFVRNGNGFPPGSKGYFKQIDDYDKQNWGDEVQEEEGKYPQKKNYAAPVGNRSAGSTPNSTRKEYKISQQEKEFALALNTKGKDGKPLSDDDKIKRFVSLREGTPASGPINMQSIRKGN